MRLAQDYASRFRLPNISLIYWTDEIDEKSRRVFKMCSPEQPYINIYIFLWFAFFKYNGELTRLGGLPHLQPFTWLNATPARAGHLAWQTGQPSVAGYLTYDVNARLKKKEFIWSGRLPHQHLHVNRPRSKEGTQSTITLNFRVFSAISRTFRTLKKTIQE